jgi:hypothetical protein
MEVGQCRCYLQSSKICLLLHGLCAPKALRVSKVSRLRWCLLLLHSHFSKRSVELFNEDPSLFSNITLLIRLPESQIILQYFIYTNLSLVLY